MVETEWRSERNGKKKESVKGRNREVLVRGEKRGEEKGWVRRGNGYR